MPRKVNYFATADWISVFIYLAMVLMGWVNIYAAVYTEEHKSIFDFSQRYGKQIIWIATALVIAIFVFLMDSRIYSFFAYFFYLFAILMLVSVLIFGTKIHGSRSWFEIGAMQLQPSEFAKFATCLALAKFLSSENIQIHSFRNLFLCAVLILLPALLILLQPDTGSALVYASLILALYREGLSPNFLILIFIAALLFIFSLLIELSVLFILLIFIGFLVAWFYYRKVKIIGIGLGIYSLILALFWAVKLVFSLKMNLISILVFSLLVASLFYLAWVYKNKITKLYFIIVILFSSLLYSYSVDYMFYNILTIHQRTRINVMLGVEKDLKGAGYNQNQALIAIGSGGFVGKGFLQGTQTKFQFVPEQTTDFIFCAVGEEWGFIGSFLVVALNVFLLLRLIYMAERQHAMFSRIYGYSVVSILFFHIAINIAMNIGIAPVIGIPLPFFSYGGSSLWGFTVLLFIFIRLDASRAELL